MRSIKNKSSRRNVRKTRNKIRRIPVNKKKRNMKKRNTKKRNTKKRRQYAMKGGNSNPFTEISCLPSLLMENINTGVSHLFGNNTPETVHVSSLPTDQPFLTTEPNEELNVGPNLEDIYDK